MIDAGQVQICLTPTELRRREEDWYNLGRLQERIEQIGHRIDEFRAEQEAERKLLDQAHS